MFESRFRRAPAQALLRSQRDPRRQFAKRVVEAGAEQKVRDKLGVKVGGGSLRAALSKFQKEHDLPATGILDQRTVESLGLDPDDVFERANAR